MTIKNIVIDIEDGIVQSVFCPDGEYNVHVLDKNIMDEDDESVIEYFKDVEKEKKNLKDCY
jgi:hypothetical protein|tara:strand:+ start:351 stop:533 length:183 start_codon:yes stop_codon:yes gene_type:complete